MSEEELQWYESQDQKFIESISSKSLLRFREHLKNQGLQVGNLFRLGEYWTGFSICQIALEKLPESR